MLNDKEYAKAMLEHKYKEIIKHLDKEFVRSMLDYKYEVDKQ